jgi:hypothetical protein
MPGNDRNGNCKIVYLPAVDPDLHHPKFAPHFALF